MNLVGGDVNEGHALPSYKEGDILSLVHVALVALQLHQDLLNQPFNKAALLTEENQMQVIPEYVYIFQTLLHGGQQVLERINHQEQSDFIGRMNGMHVLAIAQASYTLPLTETISHRDSTHLA